MEIQLPAYEKIASFDVDCQKTFTPLCPEELPVPEGDQIVTSLNQQAELASIRIGSKDAHNPEAFWIADEQHPPLTQLEAPNMDKTWPPHAIVGTPGFELLNGLPSPVQYDFFVWKGIELDLHPYGACFHDLAETMSTGVVEFLQCRTISTVIVGGLALDFCVQATALQLAKAGLQTIVNLSATRAVSDAGKSEAYTLMQNHGVILVESLRQLTGTN